jgi:hypothetical protein
VAGTYTFLVTATLAGVTRSMPLTVTCSPAPFYLQPFAASQVSVAAGQTLQFPAYLWHDDTFFKFVNSTDTDPTYEGNTSLSVSGAPAGLTVAFGNPTPTGLASSPLQVSAAPTLAAGTYPVTLTATRLDMNNLSTSASRTLTVVVTAAAGSPTLWFQNAEWGQTVVAPNLKLVAGKKALLRAQLLADRPGATAPVITAAIYDSSNVLKDTVTLAGPATVPTTVTEGDLPTAAANSASSYAAILPASDVFQGMQVVLQGLGITSQALTPAVDSGRTLAFEAVPIIVGGTAPQLPDDATLKTGILAFWPFTDVSITHRATYTTSTVVPQPTDSNGMEAGWIQLLGELASLRVLDASTSDYYGFFNPGIVFNKQVTSSIVGLSYLGDGAGLGIDQATAANFVNSDTPEDLATLVMVHELGHAFNLNHAPAGGAGSPQLNYPYAGAAIGTWGYDPVAGALYDPTSHDDVMSYSGKAHWVSDWDYISAMAYLEAKAGVAGSQIPATSVQSHAADQWVVSGWIGPDGQPHLAPMVRANVRSVEPVAGAHSLVLTSASGSRTVPFSAAQVDDLPTGYRTFSFTVPAGEELTAAEARVGGVAASAKGVAQAAPSIKRLPTAWPRAPRRWKPQRPTAAWCCARPPAPCTWNGTPACTRT